MEMVYAITGKTVLVVLMIVLIVLQFVGTALVIGMKLVLAAHRIAASVITLV